ncbi:MAG: hypothetical protein EPO22_09090 [Dehalococcoidia bacterium]|nr:MAG: hypothetical protein EPO22_09090 [Dehalococcoidia bacterium]
MMQNTEIRQGLIKAWDNVNWLATVQLTGSLQLWLTSVPVSRSIASVEMSVGRKVAVALFDPSNHTDAVVFAVYT